MTTRPDHKASGFARGDATTATTSHARIRAAVRVLTTLRVALTVIPLTLMLCVATSSGATTATEYRFSVTSEGAYSYTHTGRVVVDGGRWRIDLDTATSARAHDSVIHTSAGRRIAINHANRTWFDASTRSAVFAESLFDFYRSYPTKTSDVQLGPVKTTNGLGQSVFRYKTSVAVGGERIRGFVSGRVAKSTRDDATLASGPMSLLFSMSTGAASVDQMLHDLVMKSIAPISHLELAIERQLHKATMTQTVRWSIAPGHTVEIDSTAFEVPIGYTEQSPQIGVPGNN